MRLSWFAVASGLAGGAALAGIGHLAEAFAQDAAASPVPVSVRWDGKPDPRGVNGPDGQPFEPGASLFAGAVPRPSRSVRVDDLEVDYDGREYPLSLRVEPQTRNVQLRISIDRPKSCADVYLRPLELPTTTASASIRAALTLGYMIDGRAGENSCESRRFRAAKARFERYQNAMERSEVLVIPDSVRAGLRAAATTNAERGKAEQVIAAADEAGKQKVAVVLQSRVVAGVKSGDLAAAHASSALLLETSLKPAFASAVASQIDPQALEKQTADLAARLASEGSDQQTAQPQ